MLFFFVHRDTHIRYAKSLGFSEKNIFITLPFTSFYIEQYFSQVCATSFLIWAILKKFFKQVEVRILLSARMT
jgi:hypothetical protein